MFYLYLFHPWYASFLYDTISHLYHFPSLLITSFNIYYKVSLFVTKSLYFSLSEKVFLLMLEKLFH